VTILMGFDQHRAQITAEWVDTSTGEISRARVRPADRAGVRRFLDRFRGQQLEVALEATTGWRFAVEELRAIDAGVHLAEPAETAARRGTKRRPKSDRADARHLRELLMTGRLPESWIPPEHILDLRARVRLRHTLSAQRGEWQQRIQSVLYHHGCPQRGDLMNTDGLAWLAARPLPACAREQVTIALAVIDALDTQLAPLDNELRAYARRQPGCKALLAHYGVGPLRRSRSSPSSATPTASHPPERPSATPASTSRCTNPISVAHPGTYPAKDPQHCAGRCSKPPNAPAGAPHPTTSTTSKPRLGSAATAPASRSRANCSSAATTHSATSARKHSNPHELAGARQALRHPDAPRPAPGMLLPPPTRGRPS
jgi:transposase